MNDKKNETKKSTSGVLVHENIVKPAYGQVIIGPPGSGKTTYCQKMATFLNEQLKRKTIVINLDPANDNMEYKAEVDIMDLIRVEDVMTLHNLGPNGALVYCIEYLEKNVDWLLDKLNSLRDYYWLIDLPGQIELYTHNVSMRNILSNFERLSYHMCVVQLIDIHYCSDPSKFISTLLMALNTMLQMAMPQINILSKADLLKKHSDQLEFGLEFYTEVLDLEYLLEHLDSNQSTKKFKKLNSRLVDLIQDYSLVSFMLLDSNNFEHLLKVKNAADKANGFVYGSNEQRNIHALLSVAIGARTQPESSSYEDIL